MSASAATRPEAAPDRDGLPTLADVYAARQRIAAAVRRTPLVPSDALSERAGVPVHLKLEQLQVTGSFKLRGATNALARLSDEAKARGVIAVSTGNHGRAVAHAARAAGIPCTVCMSRLVPRNKIEAIERLGAEVRIVGNSQDDAEAELGRVVAEGGPHYLSPFDDRDVVAGQGTLGLELIEDLPELDTVLVPVSGGGLIGGAALAIKAANPAVRVIGVSMTRGAAMHASLAAGHPVAVEELPTLADSLGGGIGLGNHTTFALVRALVDELILVDEEQIAAGIRHAYREERQIVEGGAAVGIAALLAGLVRPGGPTAVVLSGANIDMDLHARVVRGEPG